MGVLAGLASALFLAGLGAVTRTFDAEPNLIYLLPLAGALIGWVYSRLAGPAVLGSHLIMQALNDPRVTVPARITPLVLFGTLITHLFGGSAGREGTAVQMAGGLATALHRTLRLPADDMRGLLMAGVSGGFGGVFGTPLAGAMFGLEVASGGALRLRGVLACLVSAFIGDLTTRSLGITHATYERQPSVPFDLVTLIRAALAAVAFGLCAALFIYVVGQVKRLALRIPSMPVRLMLGALAVIALTLAVGSRAYLGLGLPLIVTSLRGEDVPEFAFLFKLLATALTVGSGFIGGEVTPLFAIGSTLGSRTAAILGMDIGLGARLGFIGVFAGASNAPITCVLMGLELFGPAGLLYMLLVCALSALISGRSSIYGTWPAAVR